MLSSILIVADYKEKYIKETIKSCLNQTYKKIEILVGYSLPNKLTKRVGIKGLRIYLTGQNLLFKTAKGYRGLNPESRFQTGPYNTPLIDGYQRGSFPVSRTFLFGLDLNF